MSTVALVIAFTAQRRIQEHLLTTPQDAAIWEMLRKTARIAIFMAVIALALNAIALVTMYPAMMEIMQSSDLGSMLGGVGQGASGGQNTSSFWG